MTNEQFKQARLTLGLTQPKLAELLGWSTQQVSNVENGKPVMQQTALAIECLLRRADKFGDQREKL